MIMDDKTIIISCAGMGNRLGAGIPKALVKVCGKPIIIRQLELLNEYSDIRVVVGYMADKVIETVQAYRKDVLFAFNFDYKTTGTAASFSKGFMQAPTKKMTVALDGDLLVRPSDLKKFLESEEELVGGCIPGTDNPVLMSLDEENRVTEFSRERGILEWTGLAQCASNRISLGTHHIYHLLEPLMPLKVMEISTREIDTENDYNNAVQWIKNGYEE
ncbi:MAG: NTP transferase domain-containing protein [Treponema sp.]|nr:NTP transferase domain-containing protein [Treponema sp.]